MGDDRKVFARRGRGFPRGNRGHSGFRGRGRGGFRSRGHNRGSGMNHSEYNSSRAYSSLAGPRLAEFDVGITEFISKLSGFSAVLKHRYYDFHVNEIDCDGNIVKLTSLDIPKEETKEPLIGERHELIPEEVWLKLSNMVKSTGSGSSDTAAENNVKIDDHVEISLQDGKKSMNDMSADKEAASIENIGASQSKTAIKHEPQYIEFDVTALDKDSRRTIHKCVKEAFKDINSNTTEKDGKKYVVFSLGKERGNRGRWPESRGGSYLYFVVHKKNMDTTETVNNISKNLRIKPGALTFAGTKDRRGLTSQLMCLKWGEPRRLFYLSKRLQNTFLGNYSFKEKPLRLGDLKGNQFKIALRNATGSDVQINAAMESLKNNGFINYFGLQRFGTNAAVPTHSIGKALLQADWSKAIDLILQPREGPDCMTAALNEWQTSKNAKAALQKLGGKSHCLEGLLLEGLAKHGSNDIVNALSMLPRNTRSMYLHSYQSFIWNKAVSKRIREFGLKPIVGDLILVQSENEPPSGEAEIVEDITFMGADEDLSKENDTKQEVQCITEEDLASTKIGDVVLPLPGYDTVFPNNSIGIFMADLLKKDGLSSENFKQSVKQYSVKGTYRRIAARAEKLSWKIIHYDDPEADFIQSDYDEILGGKEILMDKEDGQYKAIVFSMCLEPSTYATMAIREITKEDTSASTQASMSVGVLSNPSAALVQDIESTSNESVIPLKTEEVTSFHDEGSTPSASSMHVEELRNKFSEPSLISTQDKDVPNENRDGLKRKTAVSFDEITSEKKLKDT